jgi:DNA-binding NarL/FixJ family response regulator
VNADTLNLLTRSVGPATPQPRSGAHAEPARLPVSQASRKTRILVVDDDAFVRGGIVRMLNGQPDLACCGEADSIAATPTAVAAQKPNLVLLDLKLEDGEAFGLIQALKQQSPDLPLLVLSQHDERLYAARVLQVGARGYLMKEDASENLATALRLVMDGKIYLSPAMTAHLLKKV